MISQTISLHSHLPRKSNNSPVISAWTQKMPGLPPLPCLGNVSTKFKKQITTVIRRCYFVVKTRVVFTTRSLLPATKKDVLPAHLHNNVIYQFVYYCDSRYVKRTSQWLQECIKQLVSRLIKSHHFSRDRSNLSCPCKTNSTSLKLSSITLLLDSILWKTLFVQPIQ